MKKCMHIRNERFSDLFLFNPFLSILFWTPQQKHLIDSFDMEKNTIILGDYGSGKTLILMSVAEKIIEMGRELVYVNALDYSDSIEENATSRKAYKTTEDVLDVIVKMRLGSGVNVQDMATLRRDHMKRNKGKIIKLINVFLLKLSYSKNPQQTSRHCS